VVKVRIVSGHDFSHAASPRKSNGLQALRWNRNGCDILRFKIDFLWG